MYLQSNKVFFPFVKFRTELVERQQVDMAISFETRLHNLQAVKKAVFNLCLTVMHHPTYVAKV